jgi:hypothetical protein
MLTGLVGLDVLAVTAPAAEAGGSSPEPDINPMKAAIEIALIVKRWGPKTSPSR